MQPPQSDMNEHDSEIQRRLELAVTAAREAGAITLRYFRSSDLQVDRKADDSPVTIADRSSELHLRQRIADAFPGDAILGEEFPDQPGTSGFRWVLDPIDGTKSFIHGVPLYGTLVGVEIGGEAVAGVIHIPALDECAYAAVGHGAWYETAGKPPQPIHVSQCPQLSQGLFLTSEVRNFTTAGRRAVYDRLESATRLGRTWGDCYAYLMVATGRAEVAIDPLMNPWDAVALIPVIEEAGGTYTDWEGRHTAYSGNGVATNRLVLEEVLAITRP
jgi:histidinol phosphatase-like enzyme (inositol monophosphatase family)